MGAVLDELQQLLSKQVQEHGLVNWFDPERHYQSVLHGIRIPGCQLISYDGSFFALRLPRSRSSVPRSHRN